MRVRTTMRTRNAAGGEDARPVRVVRVERAQDEANDDQSEARAYGMTVHGRREHWRLVGRLSEQVEPVR